MFDLSASADVVNCTGNSYAPMNSRLMPTAKTFVELGHSDCDHRSRFLSEGLQSVDRIRPTERAAVEDHTRSWCSSTSTSYPDHHHSERSAVTTRSSRGSVCTGPVNSTAMTTMSMTSGHASTWSQRPAGGSPAHPWRQDSAIPPRIHPGITAPLRGVYGEFAAAGGALNIKEEYSDPSDYSSDTCSDFDWTSRSAATNGVSHSATSGLTDLRHVRGHMGEAAQSMGARHRRSSNYKLTAEDDERRRVRRERNKLAAARCRQRRVDLTNQLLAETESLEDEKLQLEKEISNLQRQRHQLEFVLDSHASRCRHVVNAGTPARNHVNQLTVPPTSAHTRSFASAATAAPVSVKMERPGVEGGSSRAVGSAAGRPCSLSLSATSSGTGVGLTTTPMTFASLGLDCMVDGHTGLTPITGAPSCSAGGSQRPHDDMSAGLSPTTLMTL